MSRRTEGVDVARGVASLIMIQGHAYDGWVAPEHKASAAYLFTRLLGSLPLPAFLVLAGAAIVLRVDAGIRRDEPARSVRRSVVARGCAVIAWGYGTSLAYALMDGGSGLDTLLRADVLHVIGLSIVAFAMLAIRGHGAPDRRRLAWGAAALFVVPTLVSPWLSPLGARAHGPLRFVAALFVDVPGVTLMPFVPLAAWLGLGGLAALGMLAARRASRTEAGAIAGAPPRVLAAMALGSLAVAALSWWGTGAWVEASGEPLSRAHPAVWLNVVDLGARGVFVLSVAALAAPWMGERARAMLVRLGRGSLLAYVFHIPFCYGRLGEALEGELSMLPATGAVVVLMAVSWAVVWSRDRIRLSSRLSVS